MHDFITNFKGERIQTDEKGTGPLTKMARGKGAGKGGGKGKGSGMGGGEEEILKSSGEKITWSVLSLLKKFRSGQARLEAELLRLGAQEKPGEGQLEKVAPTDDMQVGPACSVLVEEGRKNKTSVRVVAEKATPLGLTINVPFD